MLSCLYGNKLLCYHDRRDIIKQIVVRLDDYSHQQLKIKVIKDETSVQAFLEEIVDIYINNDKTASEIIEQITK